MCEHGCVSGHGHIEYGHIPHHEFPHGVHGYQEYHGYRHLLTKEDELRVLEDWKKKLRNKLVGIEQRIGELKESGEG